MNVFDDRACALGEGPLWHPLRKQLFWFDILGCKLLSNPGGKPQEWRFDEPVSAAGWIDMDRLLVASASGLWHFDLLTRERNRLAPLEDDTPHTRSNDGRADPWGGFWIGTMGRAAEERAGAIYRFYEGEVRQLVSGLSIPNAICFAPDRSYACYADTAQQKVMKQPLDTTGWPKGAPEVFLDLAQEGLYPDGAVFDATGLFWLALWGTGEVRGYGLDGTLRHRISVPADHTTCPAFGGDDMQTLFVTSALQDLSPDAMERKPQQGMTFHLPAPTRGLEESKVLL